MDPNGSDGDGDGSMNDDDDELTLARAALSLQEFTLAKTHVDRALKSNLLTRAEQTLADQILAVVHVHTAAVASSQSQVHDWYAILQLGDHTHNIFTDDSLRFNYRRLAGLLDPSVNPVANASSAFRLVGEAYSVLSDTDKRRLFNSQIRNAKRKASSSLAFWTVCRMCFHVHRYEREYEGKNLNCPICKKAFLAVELPVEPPIVEGTDMYHCTWACYPVGFANGYRFGEEAKKEEEKAEAAPATPAGPSSSTRPKRAKQTARKTVRPVNFSLKLRSTGGQDHARG